jgi:hypothetical protein
MEPFKDVSAVRDPVSLLEYLSKVRRDPGRVVMTRKSLSLRYDV